uniref:Uncharacterized protein n=1 Tax=Arundo donax TaxID=35708 RepID=A0A0A9A054_ARUDO
MLREDISVLLSQVSSL